MRASPDSSSAMLPQAAADVLARLRAKAPRVHCITNTVAQAFTANVLLAAGATPSMTMSAAEIGDFVAGADALLVNLGTFDGERRESVLLALEVARHHGKPWVLDPVLINRSEPRAGFAKSLLAKKPAAIRLNSDEFRALGGRAGEAGVVEFAKAAGTIVALSGGTDMIADATRMVAISNGHPHMARVTAMGCAASALMGGCIAVSDDRWAGAASALLILGVAGEIAAGQSRGPGTFAAALIDALFNLDADMLRQRAKVA